MNMLSRYITCKKYLLTFFFFQNHVKNHFLRKLKQTPATDTQFCGREREENLSPWGRGGVRRSKWHQEPPQNKNFSGERFGDDWEGTGDLDMTFLLLFIYLSLDGLGLQVGEIGSLSGRWLPVIFFFFFKKKTLVTSNININIGRYFLFLNSDVFKLLTLSIRIRDTNQSMIEPLWNHLKKQNKRRLFCSKIIRVTNQNQITKINNILNLL